MGDKIPATVETFSAIVAKRTEEVFADASSTRCGSGMARTKDD